MIGSVIKKRDDLILVKNKIEILFILNMFFNLVFF